MSKSIPNYLHVFESRLTSMRDKLEDEYKKPKKDRERHNLKIMLKEAKKLKRIVHKVKDEHASHCPHCGKRI